MNIQAAGWRRLLVGLGATVIAAAGAAWGLGLFGGAPAVAEEVVVYKSPSCGCCQGWIGHMRDNGFRVTVHNVEDVEPYRLKIGVPDELMSCHTALIGGYAIEGHVPAASIQRLLSQRPGVKGLAVPGMPASAPGMDSPENEPYTVLAFDGTGKTSLWDAY